MHSWPRDFPFLFAAVFLLLFSPRVFAADYYTWTDEGGNVHISDSLENVPEQYRNKANHKTFKNETLSPEQRSEGDFHRQKYHDDQKESGQSPKKYEVPYLSHEGSAKRVIIDAVFNGSVSARLAIDTGAPGTVISSKLAGKIGLFDEEQGRLRVMTGGIGGSAPGVRSIVDTIQVGGAKIEFVPVTIIAPISKDFDGLLGLDFVSNYSVTIDAKRKVVVFEELPRDQDHPGGHDREWWTSLFREFSESRDEWKDYSNALAKKIRESMQTVNSRDEARKAFADAQWGEAEKLLDKLDRYARENSVPMYWRKYE